MTSKNLTLLALYLLLCSHGMAVADTGVALRRYQGVAVASLPMERRNFTQGLYIANREVFVSSGQYGESAVRVYRWPEMELLREAALPKDIFAEGLTLIDNRLFILTWRENKLLVLDPTTLATLSIGHIGGEGWGITHHGTQLWLSNGSDKLYRVDLENGGKVTPISVTRDQRPVYRLSELEWIEGKIWANVWMTNDIVIINPETGAVEAEIALDGLLPKADRRNDTDVLNGIALDPETGAVWVTGKRWPKLFQIELQPRH